MRADELLDVAFLSNPQWAAQTLKHLEESDLFDRIEFGREACESVLADDDAIAVPQWAKVVERIIDATPLFEDIAEELYGQRVAFDDDEGSLCQGWDEYQTLVEVAELLSLPQTYGHPQWRTLCLKLIRKSGEAGNSFDLSEVLFAPIITAGGDWASLVPAFIQVDIHEFILGMFEHDVVLAHPEFLTWVTPYKSYVMMAAAVLRAQDHAVFGPLVDLVKDERNIKRASEYAALQKAAQEKLGRSI